MMPGSDGATYILLIALEVPSLGGFQNVLWAPSSNRTRRGGHGRRDRRKRDVPSEEPFPNGSTSISINTILAKDLEEQRLELVELAKLFIMHERGTGSKIINDPRHSALSYDAAAEHALSLTRSQDTGNTTNRHGDWQVVNRYEGSQGPIRPRTEKRGTVLTAHGEDSRPFVLTNDR
jgi:hypothetical protein